MIEQGEMPVPPDWGAKALYLGKQGMNNWLAVAPVASGVACGELRLLQDRRLLALREVIVATYVSLGPGDGQHDIEIAEALKTKCPGLSYIPVEISSGLLALAIKNMSKHTAVPAAIQCDFESDYEFLQSVLTDHARPPMLFAILGGTIGNLDLTEAQFLVGMTHLLGVDDFLLFEIAIAGPAWSRHNEPRLKLANYNENFRRFFFGVSSRPSDLGATEKDLTKSFDEQFELTLEEDDVIGSKTIVARDRRTGRTILNRRYRWESFLCWLLAQGHNVIYVDSTISSNHDKLGMGWVLLSGSPSPRSLKQL